MDVATLSQVDRIASALYLFLAPDQVSELRALGVGAKKAVCEVFRDHAQMVARAVQLDDLDAKGVYFTPNPLRPDLAGSKRSAAKADVSARRWLLIDCDPVRPAHTNASEDERRGAWDVLSRVRGTLDGAGLRGPVIGDSGNGWHLCYPLDLPADDASQELGKAVLKGLHARCSDERARVDTSTFDAPRIWKLYGTRARKGPASEDRPHRWAQIVEGQPWDAEIAAANNAALQRLLGMWTWIEAKRANRPVGSLLERAVRYLEKEPPAISGQRGHDRCFHVACVLVKDFGLPEADAFAAIQTWNATCQPPWSEGELRHKLADAAKAPGEVGRLAQGNGQTNNGARPLLDAPAGPKVIDAGDIATIDDLIRAGSEVRWLWPGWIQMGVLNAVAALGGTGKTRFCADLVRRIRHQLPWPDATPMTAPADTKSLWVLADNNHDEIVTLARDFQIEPAIYLNATKADPYGGVTLETADDYAALEGRFKALRPLLVIIDTVGGATDKNLTKQEDAKAFYGPLQVIARRYSCAVLCLTHLNATGHFLGRRVLEKVRLAIRMDHPDPDNQPRRKLLVHKTNSQKPSPLGVTMGTAGNDYDTDPPRGEEAHAPRPGPAPVKFEECQAWLEKQLLAGPLKVTVIRTSAEEAGYSARLLYKSKDALGIEEYESQNRKWWKLRENIPD